jgi:hypothetical protein
LADWSPPVQTDPFEGCLEEKYDDGQSDGKQSYGGRGPAICMEVAESGAPHILRGLRVYGSRYGSGYDADTAMITITVLDAANKVVATEHVPYGRFSYKEQWVDLPFENPVPFPGPGAKPGLWTIALDPEAHRTKGIYFHYNENPADSHALVGTVDKGFERVPEREWMIRAYLARK